MPKFDEGYNPPLNPISLALTNLATDEGFVADPYYDSLGNLTAGYGFTDKKHLHHWTKGQAQKVLRDYIADKHLKASHNKEWGSVYKELPTQAQAAIINLMYQGGDNVIDMMPKFKKALMNKDYTTAGKELDWGMKQTRDRSLRRQKSFIDAIAAMNPVPKAVEPSDNTRVSIPDNPRQIVQPYMNPNNLYTTMKIKADSMNSLDKIKNMSLFDGMSEMPSIEQQLESLSRTGKMITPWKVQ